MQVVEVSHVTKDYGNGRGVFDVSFGVAKGEVVGFLGPNGAGKTTTIRQLMGFIRPDSGAVRILGKDCFLEADSIQESLGYLPGEIAFMEDMTGEALIHFVAGMKRVPTLDRAKELMEFFQFSPKGKIRKMSKGMKQKLGIICAFLQDPEILILDEPTSGLDPLMQNQFVNLILKEKARGKTILMSSHVFEEIERTCDKAVMIKDGHIVAVEEMEQLSRSKSKIFRLRLDAAEQERLLRQFPDSSCQDSWVQVVVRGNVGEFLHTLGGYSVQDIEIRTQSLEELFLHYYQKV